MIHKSWKSNDYRALLSIALLSSGLAGVRAVEPTSKSVNDKVKEIAGTAEFLRSVPKRFAILKAVDPARQRVTLLIEGETLAKVWEAVPDAEIKIAGWWGRLGQLNPGDRVWAWFQTDRAKQPTAISMLADELSEQEMHGSGVSVESFTANTLTYKSATGVSRKVSLVKANFFRGATKVPLEKLQVNQKVFIQETTDGARLILDLAALDVRLKAQKAVMRKRWENEGLPGTVVFLHRFSGEMDFMLDHEAIRWGRSLQPGDTVTLQTPVAIPAVVKQVQPWRERTQLRLVASAGDQGDLSLGQRVQLKMHDLPAGIENALLPPDLERSRTRQERIDWFLASIYCTCKVKGDTCTGHFYTLASCNPNGCGMPHHVRKVIAGKIDRGLTDKQIFEELLKEQGPDLLRPHLLP